MKMIKKSNSVKSVKGKGLINSGINALPFELHIPGYNFCGPGTKLKERLRRGDRAINPLDEACKQHDISYSTYKDIRNRHKADTILANKAWERVKSSQANLGEKTAAWAVTNVMKSKVKLGLGIKKTTFRSAVREARNTLMKAKPENISSAIKIALRAAKRIIKKKKLKTPRIIPIPKQGGVLPFLIPLFAGLSAMGGLAGGAASIAKAVNEAHDAKKRLQETHRHNTAMESVAVGEGLYIKPYKKGLGLYLPKKCSKNC